jgi:hypothetical protein
MARIRKAAHEDTGTAVERSLSRRARIAQEYDALLADFAVGDYGKVDLSDGEQRLTVRSRLQAAARRRRLSLRFRPGPSTALIFHVQAAEPPAVPAPRAAKPEPAAQPKPAAAAQAPAQPQRGRPRQQASQPDRRDAQPQRREAPDRREPQPARDSAAERWGRMLPRWMREGGRSGNGRPGGQNRRRPR